jgi:hypothetical protein
MWSLSFWLSHKYSICFPLLPHSCYMPCPSHPPSLDHSNYVWRGVQVMKFLIMQFSPISYLFILKDFFLDIAHKITNFTQTKLRLLL